MPSVPVLEPKIGGLPLSGGGTFLSPTAGAQGYEALGETSEAAGRLAAANARIEEAQKYGQALGATAKASRELQDLSLKYEDDQDYATAPQRFRAEADEIRQRYVGSLQDEGVQALFMQKFDARVLPRELAIKQSSRTKGIDATKAAGEDNVNQLIDQAAQAANPLERQAAINEIGVSYDGLASVGVISQVDAVRGKKNALGRVDEAAVRNLMTASPEAAAKALLDNKQFPHLDEVRRSQLMDTAFTRSAALQAQRERAEERAQNKAEEDTAKNGWDLLSQGRLTPDWIRKNKGNLSAGEFRALMHSAAGEGAADDKKTIADLTPRLATENVSKELTAAFTSGKLKESTYRSMMGTNQGFIKEDSPANPYKSARQLIKDTLDPTNLLTGPAAQIAKGGMANAQVEFDDWMKNNPSANRGDAQIEARNIIKRYQIINYEQQALATGLPRAVGTGVTRQTLSVEDLDRAERQTVADLDAKKMSKEMAASEIDKINNWRQMLMTRPPEGSGSSGGKSKPSQSGFSAKPPGASQ